MEEKRKHETDGPCARDESSPRIRRAEAFTGLGLELTQAENLQTVGYVLRDFCSQLWDWDALLFSARRGRGSRYFRPVLIVDTVDGEKIEWSPYEFEPSEDTKTWNRLLESEPVLINRKEDEESRSIGMIGDTERASASLMYVPLCSGKRMMGVLSLQSYSFNKYDDDDLALLQRIADAVGPTVLRCRAEDRMHEFLNLGERLNQMVDVNGVTRVVACTAATLVGWDFLSLHLYDAESDVLHMLLGLRRGDLDCQILPSMNHLVSEEGSVVAEVLDGRPILLDTKSLQAEDVERLYPFGRTLPILPSIILFPIRSVDRIIGLLCLQSESPMAFGSDEEEVARGLADYCSGALERAWAQQKLQQSEERHRLLVENVNDGIVISRDDHFVFFNHRFAAMLGYEYEELKQKNYRDVYTEQGLAILYQRAVDRTSGVTVPDRYETLFCTKNGETLPVEANVRVIQNYHGKPATFAVIRDMSERREAEAEIFRSNARYKAVLDGSEDYIFVLDREMRFVHVNSVVERRFGLSPSDRIGKTLWDIYGNRPVPDFVNLIKSVFSTCSPVTYDDDSVISGVMVCTETIISPIFAQNGEVEAVLGISRDVTGRRQAAKALEKSEQRYAIAVRGANDGIWDWNLETAALYLSPRWWAIIGENESNSEIDKYPTEWFDHIHEDDLVFLKEKIFNHIQGKTPHLEDEHRIRHADGEYRWVLCRGLCVRDDTGKAVRMGGSLSDITARKDAEEKLQYGASHDALTGLPNRTSFLENLTRCMCRTRRRVGDCGPFAVLFLDLDRFKVINDSLGHLAGDELICIMARRLEKCVRPGDTVARISGDEFTVLLEELRQDSDVTRISDRIIRELSRPVDISGFQVQVTVSMGIAFDKNGYSKPEDLLRDADTAMYRTKESGRNGYQVFDQAMHNSVMAQLKSERDLRRAVAEQEFVLHYQPIYSLPSRRLAGFEALLRWNHPKKGMVSPLDFIPLAEETGLIIPMGWWIISEATKASIQWNEGRAGDDRLSVSINVSPKQFSQPKLVSRIKFLIEDSGARPEDVVLEITESLLMEDHRDISEILQQMRSQGIRFALDDFGTGYSSLSFLRRSELDIIKIDQSFVRDMESSKNGMQIVNAMMTLARGLGLKVTAEGVETQEQYDALVGMQCDRAQGYFFHKPMPLERALEVVRVESEAQADPA